MELQELTALYSSLDIQYNQVMSGPYIDHSIHTEDVTVIAGLKDGKLNGFWRPMVSAGDEKLARAYIEGLYNDISKDITYYDFMPGGNITEPSKFLLGKGFKATPVYFQTIHLNRDISDLRADLRKSYKSLTNKPGAAVIDEADWRNYVDSIRAGAGCIKNRPGKTIDIQWEMDLKGQCFCVIDDHSYALIYHNRHRAYYASGRSIGPNMHATLWTAILEARTRGCEYFDMGEQIYRGDIKLVDISKFKRGFGGFTKTHLLLEKQK